MVANWDTCRKSKPSEIPILSNKELQFLVYLCLSKTEEFFNPDTRLLGLSDIINRSLKLLVTFKKMF